jgi:hypothetical protein
MWPPAMLVSLFAWVWPGVQTADFSGTWTGRLTNLPERPAAAVVEVTREVGPMPVGTGCTPWKTTYREGGQVRQVKDYRLCREGDVWFVDEGDGVRLSARMLGDVLVSPFKYGALLLVVRTEVRGDVMEEDIVTADDQPATAGIVSLTARNLQRLRLTRVRAAGRVQ